MNTEIRDFADGILQAIGQPLLTDVEAAALPDYMDEPKVHEALAKIINGRQFPDDGIKKLNAYAVLHDVEFGALRKVNNNIFIGGAVE